MLTHPQPSPAMLTTYRQLRAIGLTAANAYAIAVMTNSRQ